MDEELKERLEKAHDESKKNPGVKKKGCTSCKKKQKEITKFDKVEEIEDILGEIPEVDLFIPTPQEINLAYAELTSLLGVKEEAKPLIQRVYKYIFNEEFDFTCNSCVNKQARRFRLHLGR
jgi:hypothetical protein